MRHVLVIDTSSNKKISVGLKINNTSDQIEQDVTLQKAQVLLPLIDNLLRKHGVKLTDITAIEVNTGPGSFTGLRVGVTIANALEFALRIPVNGEHRDKIVLPRYE